MILTVTLNPALDETFFVDRLKPHDTNRIQRIECDAGGKGVNLSRVAAELGVKTTATGFLGGKAGSFIRHVLTEQGVTDAFIQVPHETRTVWSVESGDGPPTTFNGKGERIPAAKWDALVDLVAELATHAAWVTIGGSMPEGVPSEAYVILGQVARAAGARVLIDADGEVLLGAMAFQPDLIKPNTPETERLVGRRLANVEEVKLAAAELQARLRPDSMVIISRGGKGAVLATATHVTERKAIKVAVRSSIGSGDSMLAGFLVGLMKGMPPEKALTLGCAAGAATAESTGAGIARLADVDRLLQGG